MRYFMPMLNRADLAVQCPSGGRPGGGPNEVDRQPLGGGERGPGGRPRALP